MSSCFCLTPNSVHAGKMRACSLTHGAAPRRFFDMGSTFPTSVKLLTFLQFCSARDPSSKVSGRTNDPHWPLKKCLEHPGHWSFPSSRLSMESGNGKGPNVAGCATTPSVASHDSDEANLPSRKERRVQWRPAAKKYAPAPYVRRGTLPQSVKDTESAGAAPFLH